MKTRSNIISGIQDIIFLAACLSLISSCTKENLAPPGKTPTIAPSAVFIQNNAFVPSSLTVLLNTTVTWTNKGNVPQTVTSTKDIFSSGTVADGATYSYQFTAPGTYAYYSTLDTAVTGTIVVLTSQ